MTTLLNNISQVEGALEHCEPEDQHAFSELKAALLSAHQAQGERARTRHFEVDPQSEKLAVARVRPSIGVTQPARHYIEALADIPAGTQIYIVQPPSAKTVLASPAAQSGADELPPLPSAEEIEQAVYAETRTFISVRQAEAIGKMMRDYARAAVELSRAQTAPAVSLSSVDLASDERALLQKAAQVISWHSFGECRAFGDGPIPEPSEVVGQIKEVLSRTAPQPVAEQVRKAEAASDWISLKNSIPNGNEQVITLTEKGTVGIHHASTVRDLVREELRGIDKCYLTHWQPLPAHPQAAQAKESGDE